MTNCPHVTALGKLLRATSRRYRLHEVFRDFCELSALSISNAVDKAQYDAREARYLQIVQRYERSEIVAFPQMLGLLVQSLGARFHDALGALFMDLELGDHWKGQFFTPYELASFMAQLTLGDVRPQVEARGFIEVNEPACGAGAMVIACADALLSQDLNYQQTMHVTAQDIDQTACHMAYIQLSLLHIPAIVVHGNTLSRKTWSHFVTPAHVLGAWDARLRRRRQAAALLQLLRAPASPPTTVEPGETVPHLVALRTEIVTERLAHAEQLSLFG